MLLEPMTRSSWGDRAFSKAAPVLWNALPRSIRTAESLNCFKSSLKTYYLHGHLTDFSLPPDSMDILVILVTVAIYFFLFVS